jgi:hypothetical protein
MTPPTAAMTIRLADPEQVADLLHFLRERGCIAYAVEAVTAIEALRPDASASDAAAEIRQLVDAWLAEHPSNAAILEAA